MAGIHKKSPIIHRLEHVPESELTRHSGKKMFLVVHPFYERKPNKGLEDFIKSGGHKNNILVVSEGKKEMEGTHKKLIKFGIDKGDPVYYIEIGSHDNIPRGGWSKMISKIDKMSPKYVVVGGRRIDPYSVDLKELKELKSNKKTLIDSEKMALRNRTGKAWAGCAGGTWLALSLDTKHKVYLTNRFT